MIALTSEPGRQVVLTAQRYAVRKGLEDVWVCGCGRRWPAATDTHPNIQLDINIFDVIIWWRYISQNKEEGTCMISYDDFTKVDIRVGRIIQVEDFPQARKPAYKLRIDFGPELGIKRSSAQITNHYTKEELIGRQVIAVVNFPPKQIGPFISEVLTLGVPDSEGKVVLLSSTKDVPLGGKMF
jgi:tRNA-binding protein